VEKLSFILVGFPIQLARRGEWEKQTIHFWPRGSVVGSLESEKQNGNWECDD
jgi:hypothetical protein